MKIILASKSPRRKELLSSIGLKFLVRPSNFCELDSSMPAEKLVTRNARGKARDIAGKYKDAIVIGVDTIGSYRHHILEKPQGFADARRILNILNGTTHDVLSAVCMIDTRSGREMMHLEKTQVTFDKMSKKQIENYIMTGEAMDKAAAFAAQGKGALFIKKINGCYFNVVGLPLNALRKMLEKFEVYLL